jgi:hypothetical protein
MTNEITILLVLLWLPFLIFNKKSLVLISFSATMLYIFNLLELIDETNIYWMFLGLFGIALFRMMTERE